MRTVTDIPDLQTRKLRVIENIIRSQDEVFISQVESLIGKARPKIRRMTKEELVNRIKQSEEDIRCGRVITQEDLEKQSENW